jgi:uncharacterized protein YbjT (DUF2867 family)
MEVRDVLVTGGTGRLGRRVVDRLRAEGLEPRIMSRSGPAPSKETCSPGRA